MNEYLCVEQPFLLVRLSPAAIRPSFMGTIVPALT
jgi:hypothetical protein